MNETCGCCEGLESLTPLTTANRPGLDALAYRAGTHATFLEAMKARLSASKYPTLTGLTTREATDPSIALLDAWATVADVLTFYQERIANEGYLRTATERRSILELARLVGYVPRPGVAASVYLAFTLEESYRVKVPVGTRAQSLPGPGERPQFFETAEELEARVEWNVLKPRLGRPQSLRPLETEDGDVPPRRLYLKGVATNLKPNTPILIDFGEIQEFRRVQTVEPDLSADRTLVTLRPEVSPAPGHPEPTDPIEEIREKVDSYLDLQANEVSPERATTRRVVGLLEEWRVELTPETPPEQLANSLRERVLPQVRQDLSTARERNYRQLLSWLENVEGGLRGIEERLSQAARAEPGGLRASSTPGGMVGSAASVAENGDGSVRPLSATFEELLKRLAKLPSAQPTDASRLPRRLERSFGPDSGAVTQLLTALRPGLRDALYQAWERTGAQPSTVRVYALRATTSPFGHNAPLRPILEDGRITRYEEWTLDRLTPTLTRPFVVTVTSEPGFEGPTTIRTHIQTGDTGDAESVNLEEGARFSIQLLEEGELIETITGVLSSVEGDYFTLALDFEESRMVVTVQTHAGYDYNQPTRVEVQIQTNGEFEVSSTGSTSTEVTLEREEATTPTEQADVVSLDAPYEQIVPGSWVVLERPNAAEAVPERVITRVGQVREASRADYGMTAKGTQVGVSRPWLDLDRDTFAVIRGTSVHAQSELLELGEAPPESVGTDGAVKVEPVGGNRIPLDTLYEGLEPGRWLFVTGEREDLPGVRASELVMLAGVEQGVRQAELTEEDLRRRRGGEAQSIKLIGRGSTGPGGYDLTVSVNLLPDGSATGYAHFVGGATGDVIGVEPPSEERDFWCINVRRTDTSTNSGDQRVNIYIRDVGDGRTTFDQISFVTSIGGDCGRFPDPPGVWIPLIEGDFRASVDQPDEKVHSTLILANDLAYPYRRETVEIYGNVARATHGETRGEVLGSGDGSKALQRFSLKQSPLTYVAATTPTGVESTLKAYVNEIRWHEAEHLAGLQPTDRGFITQTDDQSEVTVVFGDGERGARLPTGVENVRAVYRTGIGKAGNVAAEQINLLATRPLGLKGVINPLPATGGANRETRDQARRNAPLGVKVLDRLVSVRDYEDFARAFAGVGKASAVRLSDGRQQLVHLTIAGADDIPIAESSDLYRHLIQALLRFGDPQQPLRVEVRELILLIISAGVRLLPDYLWESVEPKIRAALLETFGFEQRDLGQDALLSEVIGTIQHIPGVSYVDVDTFGGIPEKTVDPGIGLRRPLFPSEIEAEITKLVKNEDQPFQRVPVALAGLDGSSIHPTQLAFLTPQVPDTLILKEITV